MLEKPVVCEPHVQRLSGIDSCQPLHARGEVVVGIRPIHYPPAFASSPTRSESKTPVILGPVGILNADEMKFCFGRKGWARLCFLILKSKPLSERCDRKCEKRCQC